MRQDKQSMIDEKTVFSSLQTEINARVIARASINSFHFQVILAFASACITLKVAAEATPDNTKILLGNLFFIAGLIIPLASLYYISLYIHNDMQIGLLNKCMRKIEEKSEISDDIKFYKIGGIYSQSFNARKWSHYAVLALSTTSPSITLIEQLYHLATHGTSGWNYTSIQTILFVFAGAITIANVILLSRLQKFREDLIKS